MKRNTCVLLVMLMLSFMFGCNKSYHVTIVGAEDIITDLKESYRKGEEVRLTVMNEVDSVIAAYIGSEELEHKETETGQQYFTFIMPDHDVEVAIESRQKEKPYDFSDCLLVYSYTSGAIDSAKEYPHGYNQMDVMYQPDTNRYVLVARYACGTDKEFMEWFNTPSALNEKIEEIITRYDMTDWDNVQDTVSLDGVMLTFYFERDGVPYYLTTEKMPLNGREAFDEISMAMNDYLLDY